MWRLFPRIILASTSFAPLLGVAAVTLIDNCPWWSFGLFVVVFIMVSFCWKLMSIASKKGEIYKLHIKEFSRSDQGVHTFLVIYLLPIIRSPESLFALMSADWKAMVLILCVLASIVAVIIQIGAYNFNPVLCLLKYRFYQIKDSGNMNYLLITKEPLPENNIDIQVWQISDDVFVQTENDNA